MWWMVPLVCWMGAADAAKRAEGPEVAVVGVHVPGQTDESSLRLALQVAPGCDLTAAPAPACASSHAVAISARPVAKAGCGVASFAGSCARVPRLFFNVEALARERW